MTNSRSSTRTQGSGRMLRAKDIKFVSRDENIRLLRAKLAIARRQAALWKQAAKEWRQTAKMSGLWKQAAKEWRHDAETQSGELKRYQEWVEALQTELAEWKQAAEEAQEAQLAGQIRLPLVGTLSANTRPEDFAQYAAARSTQYAARNTE